MRPLLLLGIATLLAGCNVHPDQAAINALPRPVTVVATDPFSGTVLSGADGSILFLAGGCQMANVIWASGFKPGQVFIPAPPDKPLPDVEKALQPR